ncbi:MAG: GvpL/GvpF family gas vesicle protein [Anaerolineae bacterium]|nr:GvpL/GvpF family gas vesicle protein [Anaerolineae bacterium]
MSASSDDERMIYLYCLTRSHDETPLNLPVRGIGERGDEVYSVPFLDLAFAVSNSPQDEYETSRANTMSHQLVCEEVMKEGDPVVPARFGTIARPTKSTAEEKIKALLKRRYGELHEILREMEQKDEQGLKVFWRKERLFQDIVRENREICLMRNRLAAHPHSHYDRIELGTLIEEAIEAKRDVDAQKLALALSPLAERYETNKVLMDMMVLNAAFLVHRSRIEEFDHKVNELDEKYGERMKLNYVGPVPPFNFVELVIHWEEAEEELEVVRKGKIPGPLGS